jgi:hypothetical protein
MVEDIITAAHQMAVGIAGKAERFIQTSLREWAYARAYLNSKQRGRILIRRQGRLAGAAPCRG